MLSQLYYLVLLLVGVMSEEPRGRYTRGVSDYQIVVPKKISEDGEFVSYYLPHYYNIARVRRGADTGKVHYMVPINGEDRVLELLPSEEFHAPGMVIEHHEQDAKNNVNTVKLRRPRKANCYYHGKVKDEEKSSAAITACSGLAGAINLGREQYLIEPVEDDGTPSEGPEHKHLLYKQDQKPSNYSSCGATGTFATAFEDRMRWEEKHGEKIEETMTSVDDLDDELIDPSRKKRWCTTCKPAVVIKCQTPYPACLLERPLFIELLIVIDHRVESQQFLNEDVEQYVNTIINIAVRHFMDASLGRPILVKLVRVITLGFLYPDLDPHRYEAEDLLERFCDWQLHFNPQKEAHPNHHDFAIYLAKFGSCKNLFGLTSMAGMCRPDKSCGIVSQEGLLTGHIVTHMLGHSLGADHDDLDAGGCCPEEPDGTRYHMAKYISARSSAFSVCSKQCILKFTDTHAAWCLTDKPTMADMTEPTLLPGQVYTAAEQCRINFEIDSSACLVGEFCKRLYCKVSDTECASNGEPPAQGTRCGPDQWCFNGRCVHRGSRPGSVNGEWGIWSPWTPCTKTCGGGIQTSHRSCDSPAPSADGRLCPGAWIKSRMCNVGTCSDGGRGFLDQQCRNTNVRPFHGRKHEWQYFNQQVEDLKCVVMCINERNEVAVRFPVAVDGTYCNPGTKDVCIRGECTRVGCDWVIGSQAKEDACGVCHGNGTECRIMQGFFSESNFKGKMPFLKLPIGTSMILIRETRPSPCYFIISNSLNSTNYLNSDNENDQPPMNGGIFKMKNTVGIYQLKALMERIFIRDSIPVPITVSTFCSEEEANIGILYQYALPEPMVTTAKYTWEYLSWEKCPTPCGGAIQRAIPVCVEAQGGEVEDSYCVINQRPQDKIRVCNPRPCDAKWWVGPWVDCDCYMNDGLTTRMVMCAHMKEAKSSYIQLVPEKECLGVRKPSSMKPCDPKKNQEMWRKKGYVKRDVTDIIPYSKSVEDLTIWDDVPEESSSYMTNVRHVFQKMDPENIEDYLYMKKIGVTSELWKTIHQTPQRVRKRRKIVVATSGPNMHEAIYRTTNERAVRTSKVQTTQMGHTTQKSHTTRATSRKYVMTKKTNHLLEIKTYLIKVPKEEQGTLWGSRIISTTPVSHVKFFARAMPRDKHTTEAYSMKALSSRVRQKGNVTISVMEHKFSGLVTLKYENTNRRMATTTTTNKSHKGNAVATTSKITKASGNKTIGESTRHVTKSVTSETTTKHGEQEKTESPHLKTAQTQTKSRITVKMTASSASKEVETTMMNTKAKNEAAGKREATTAATEKVQKTKDPKAEVEAVGKHEATIAVTKVIRTTAKRESKAGTDAVSNHKVTAGQLKASGATAMTVIVATDDPGLPPYSLYATDTPAPQGKCWKSEIKPTKEPVSCRPREDNQSEPADDLPELDFFNTSKVKIYVVPIKTTIRTIIQNDQEYVIMETLAKYPVGDELNVVEHWGDDAKKQLQRAKDKAERTTGNPLIQD